MLLSLFLSACLPPSTPAIAAPAATSPVVAVPERMAPSIGGEDTGHAVALAAADDTGQHVAWPSR